MSDNRKSILTRAYVIYVFVLIFGLLIIGKIAYLQWWQGAFWRQQSENLIYKYQNIEARRGNIYSDNENLLATSEIIYDIGMDVNPKIVNDSIFYSKIDTLTRNLAKLFNKPQKQFLDKLLKARAAFKHDTNSPGYVLLQKNVTFAELEKIRSFPILKMGRYRGGLVADGHERRMLSYKNLAERTIGYVQLAQYDVTINLGKGRISKDDYVRYIDTLSFYMYNLFHDGISVKRYRSLLQKSYFHRSAIVKRVDSKQLQHLLTFPIIDQLAEGHGLKMVERKKEYKVGLEGAYNDILSGRDGTRILKKMGGGTWRIMSDEDLVEPENGHDIFTSIDIDLQDVADNALRKCLDSNKAQWGCAVLMEVKTGLVKAIVNLSRDSSGQYREKLNYAIGQQIEPGSTFKLASVIACLEDGLIDTSTLVPTGTGTVGFREVKDSHAQGYGKVTLKRAFEVSSNLGISSATYKLFYGRISKFRSLLKKMGITDSLGIEIAGEPAPKMDINPGDLETIPYGYVVKMTPLQILALYNAVANNGTMVRPRFVKAIRKAGGIMENQPDIILRQQICSKETLAKVQKMLEGVVSQGTAKNISRSDYEISGKTGTVRIHEKGKYIDKYVASFVGYFPANEPKYSCIVVVSRPMGNEYYGSLIAAPVFKQIADRVYASRLDIYSSKHLQAATALPPLSCIARQKDIREVYKVLNFDIVSANPASEYAVSGHLKNGLRLRSVTAQPGVMPDVTGMGARNAVFLLENLGLKVSLKGKGVVKRQSLHEGTEIRKNHHVTLELSM